MEDFRLRARKCSTCGRRTTAYEAWTIASGHRPAWCLDEFACAAHADVIDFDGTTTIEMMAMPKGDPDVWRPGWTTPRFDQSMHNGMHGVTIEFSKPHLRPAVEHPPELHAVLPYVPSVIETLCSLAPMSMQRFADWELPAAPITVQLPRSLRRHTHSRAALALVLASLPLWTQDCADAAFVEGWGLHTDPDVPIWAQAPTLVSYWPNRLQRQATVGRVIAYAKYANDPLCAQALAVMAWWNPIGLRRLLLDAHPCVREFVSAIALDGCAPISAWKRELRRPEWYA